VIETGEGRWEARRAEQKEKMIAKKKFEKQERVRSMKKK
jgi:hypothetical protein